MSTQTAKFIIHREGLSCFSLRELSELLTDPHKTMPDRVRQAILTLKLERNTWTTR
jgi:hypothetical protein